MKQKDTSTNHLVQIEQNQKPVKSGLQCRKYKQTQSLNNLRPQNNPSQSGKNSKRDYYIKVQSKTAPPQNYLAPIVLS